jgi:preprotein translocase subunit SecG
MTFGLALLVLFLVLLGGVVALVLLLRSKSAGLPV